VGGNKGGPMSAANFKAQGGLFAKLDSDFDAPFIVVGYTLGANIGGIYRETAVEGARWPSDGLIKQAMPGNQVFFDKIRVKGPDNVVRELAAGIFFNLK